MTERLNRVIEYSFYAIFFLVPLFFTGNTYELFEFNKMWLAFGLTVIIVTAWICKMLIEKKFIIKSTPLDIPIIVFLVALALSTLFSMDRHISLWGYYSRFNGGLYSIIAYILLYYAFVSNLNVKHAMRSIVYATLGAGLATALWGFPSRFGYDPTCYVFRGTLNTDCWTEAFKPTIRAFSTLGQPAWFAAYLNILLPISMVLSLVYYQKQKKSLFLAFFSLTLLFYACLIFANTRAGYLGFASAEIVLWIILFYKKVFSVKVLLKYFLIIHFALACLHFIFGAPIGQLTKFTWPHIKNEFKAHANTSEVESMKKAIAIGGITDSAQIRMIVWRGAIDAWKANPIVGTGVETFALAYYKYKPEEQSLTSEWDYLYNKAHNEYLNYLTTTGFLGLGAYMAIILVFIFTVLRFIVNFRNPTTNNPAFYYRQKHFLIAVALFCSYISILVTNFFGFSVVIINIYFFLIPAMIYMIAAILNENKKTIDNEIVLTRLEKKNDLPINGYQWTGISIILLIAVYMLVGLWRYWQADTEYALGHNLDRIGNLQQAYPLLQSAVKTIGSEPVYKDELALNLSMMAGAIYADNDAATADQLAIEAIRLSNEIIEGHPNNIVFWKNRLRVFYSLASAESQNRNIYLQEALKAVFKSRELAPTDAKLAYNAGIILFETGRFGEGIEALEQAIRLKPDYLDAYKALGIMYNEISEADQDASPSAQQAAHRAEYKIKAIDLYQFMLDNLSPDNKEIKKSLDEWRK